MKRVPRLHEWSWIKQTLRYRAVLAGALVLLASGGAVGLRRVLLERDAAQAAADTPLVHPACADVERSPKGDTR